MLENPLSESPTFLEPLSPWKQIKPVKGIHHSSFDTLQFEEKHVQDPPEPSSCSSASSASPPSSLSSVSVLFTDANLPVPAIDIQETQKYGSTSTSTSTGIYQEKNESYSYIYGKRKHCRHSDSFSSMNSESLSLCTEGLGFESFDDVEDTLRNDILGMNDLQPQEERRTSFTGIRGEYLWGMRSRTSIGSLDSFPPPISCIGRSGKPLVCFRSFKQDGRFVLKEIRIPTQDLLHACRENGRLRMKFVASEEDEIVEEEQEDVEEKDEDDDTNEDGELQENDRNRG